VLSLAKKLAGERDLGSTRPIDDIRKSLDELLLKYNESSYVSADYRTSMDHAGARAAELAARGLPEEMDAWLDTLGANSVRKLSGQLLIDLLRNEMKADRLGETARDMSGFAEELVLAGVFDEALPVIEELAAAAVRKPPLAPEACRAAIDTVARSAALAESAAAIGEHSTAEFKHFHGLILALGPATVPSLVAAYGRDDGGAAIERITGVLIKLGAPAIHAIGAAMDDSRWFVQRELARALGQIGTPAAIPPLQAMLRRSDPRVLQAAVAALARIDDPGAARALHMALKAATGEARAAVINALVGLKNARVVPLLMRILQDSEPFGSEHPLVIETLAAIGSQQDDRAVPAVVSMARRRRWFAWGKTRRIRHACLRALVSIATPQSEAAVAGLRRSGDFFLRRMAARVVVAPK
jgi:HEAT repeat protein